MFLNATPGCEKKPFDSLWQQNDIQINNFFEWYKLQQTKKIKLLNYEKEISQDSQLKAV